MTEPLPFSAMLGRLLRHRELGVPELADRAGALPSDIRAVLAGAPPAAGLLRRLAAASGLHAVDLFVLAGMPVPDDLVPSDAAAARWVPDIAQDGARRLSAAQSRHVAEPARSMQPEPRNHD
ncbi:hypothetical protein [Kitasatospora sp. NPDC057015]|uniref:hypothetical protein n=1 Tax=Kitasatospora sp. NPDC057015 TaxID=3346001 RepID=UPI003631271F